MEEYSEINTCRICLNISEKMKNLFHLTFPKDDSTPVDFIRKITDLKLQNSETFPKNICNSCTKGVFAAFEFCKMCINSDTKLRNQETQRILRRIEAEALEEEEIIIKVEEPIDNESELYDVGEEEDPLAHVDDFNEIEKHVNPPKTLPFTTAREKNKYKCLQCSTSFNNKTKFHKHQKTHEECPFKCSECNQAYSKQLHLNVHLRSHIKPGDKKFGCKDCGKQFIYEYLLKQHEFKHRDEKPYPCTKCDKGCLTAESLRRHTKIHEENYMKKTHICHLCSKTFAYPSFLVEHMKNHTGEKPYLCKICGKGFRQNGALHFHERIHSGYKPFSCKFCKENFMSRSILKVHIRKHTQEKPYICDTCGVSFRQSTDLKSHRRVHTGEKLVLCTICGKKLNTTGQLTVHLRSHTGERPFSCRTCLKSFSARSVLVKHEKIHTDDRPYSCDICDKAFIQRSTLRTHSKTHKKTTKGQITCATETKSRRGDRGTPKEKSRYQYGFLKSCDTESAAVDVVTHFQMEVDCNKTCALLSLDLKKAFDTVDHNILLGILYNLGIRGREHTWFLNYLSNRKQFVYMGEETSSSKTVLCGVPEGSILGPVFFLIYINSIQYLGLKGKAYLFADDTTLVYSGNNVEEINGKILSDLNILSPWLSFHKLTLIFIYVRI